MNVEFKLVSSLEKVFFENPCSLRGRTHASILRNELHSFQLVGWMSNNRQVTVPVRVEIDSLLKPYISVYRVGYVPSMLPAIQFDDDDDYLTKMPGLFPDPLYPVRDGQFTLCDKQSRALWITVEPDGNMVGSYPVTFKVFDQQENQLAELNYTVDIIDAFLPETACYNTCWFHGDCLAVLHHVDIQSEEYYRIVEKYLKIYTKFGHNTILTPIFTPPLDTEVGGERPTNQLIDVVYREGTYSFGFDKLKFWIKLCAKCGIKYFEIAHLFTQWGAKHAPKIMANVDGTEKKIFGWETEALSGEYREFLHALMPQLVSFLKEEQIFERCFFHISDEPSAEHEEQYWSAKKLLLNYVDESRFIDALADYSYYEKGIVTMPVVANDHIHTFIEHGAQNLWTYYCMGQRKDVANRFMAMPSYRNRILGYQLYKYRIKGFLQWGFNFWFARYSKRVVDPFCETDAGRSFPSGDAFVVYPMNSDDEVICSLRLYVFLDGWQDMRALQLLESLTDRETVEEMLTEIEGFTGYPRSGEYILALREAVNRKICEYT